MTQFWGKTNKAWRTALLSTFILLMVLSLASCKVPGVNTPDQKKPPKPAPPAFTLQELPADYDYPAVPQKKELPFVDLFVDSQPRPELVKKYFSAGKFEPEQGCYLGAYVVWDDQATGIKDSKGVVQSREKSFGQLVNKKLASSFTYMGYGKKDFPLEWAQGLVAEGIIPHIAVEPNEGLDPVKDDAYLEKFSKDCASLNYPILMRFASEMNGDWVAYGGNPKKYIEKWRMVHDVFAKNAPNVAFFWCPFVWPQEKIESFYPGDEYVDYVGLNVYDIYYHNNKKTAPAFHENPTDLFNFIYITYAARKPIIIGEFGAAKMDSLDKVPRIDFAASKMSQMITALPRYYPRVKMFNFFDCDNMKHAPEGRMLSNYSITDDNTILGIVQKNISRNYYLADLVDAKNPPKEVIPIIAKVKDGATWKGIARVSAWVKVADFKPTVVYTLDGVEVFKSTTQGDYRFDLDTAKYAPGPHTIKVEVFDQKNKSLKSSEAKVVFAK
ncbi:MAG: glycosyl hydrolase [bacterium]